MGFRGGKEHGERKRRFWGGMMPMSCLKDLCGGVAVPIFLGIVSSAVRASRFGLRSWGQFFSSVTASCFVAVLIHWGLDYARFAPTVDAAIIGIGSYMGGSLLDAVQTRVLREVVHGEKKPQEKAPDESL